MLDRRNCLTASLAVLAAAAGSGLTSSGARAQAGEKATAFVQQTGDKLVSVVNGTMSTPDKRRALTQIIEASVDVDSVARFCLGRFWRTASVDQQKRFVNAFHEV
ncbi:MAG: ABC transporter substrate-binding protein, partial [Acetobacteraceae bacterium]